MARVTTTGRACYPEAGDASPEKPMKDVLEAALRAENEGEVVALVTVVATEGSTPQKAGAKMVVFADGRIVGTIGGGCVEAEMTWRARQAIETRRPQLASCDLTPDQAGED